MTTVTGFNPTQSMAQHTRQNHAASDEAHQPSQPVVNVSDAERIVSAIAGSGLLVAGLRRQSLGGLVLAAAGGALVYRGISGHCGGYQLLGVNNASHDHPATGVKAGHGFKVERAVTINRSAQELFDRWRDFEKLPEIMSHLVSVTRADKGHTHWIARGPLGTNVEWDAEIINERAGELIAWRSLPGSQVDTAGSVHFEAAPGDRGTVLRVSLKYDPPGGKVGATIAGLLGANLESQVTEDLRRFKQVMEAGESPTVAGQPQGQCSARASV